DLLHLCVDHLDEFLLAFADDPASSYDQLFHWPFFLRKNFLDSLSLCVQFAENGLPLQCSLLSQMRTIDSSICSAEHLVPHSGQIGTIRASSILARKLFSVTSGYMVFGFWLFETFRFSERMRRGRDSNPRYL